MSGDLVSRIDALELTPELDGNDLRSSGEAGFLNSPRSAVERPQESIGAIGSNPALVGRIVNPVSVFIFGSLLAQERGGLGGTEGHTDSLHTGAIRQRAHGVSSLNAPLTNVNLNSPDVPLFVMATGSRTANLREPTLQALE